MAVAHTLAVRGLADQAELFAFASALEVAPGIRGIGLVRADDTVGVFSVLTSNRQDLLEACRQVPGFVVDLQDAAPGRDVIELTAGREAAEPEPAPAPRSTRPRFTLLSDENTLPRSRLPVFGRRPAEDGDDEPSAEGEAEAFPADPMPHWPALDDAIETVLTTEGPPRGEVPLWPLVEVDVFAPALDLAIAEREVVHLVAAPLRSFGQVTAFRERLAELEGVVELKVGRFYRGALQVTVDYVDATPLIDRLQELRDFAPRALRRRDARTIEITLPT